MLDIREEFHKSFVWFTLQINDAVVGVFREGMGDAERRLINPHEVVVTDHERHGEHGAGEDFRRFGAFCLRFEALSRAIGAWQAGIQCGEGPFRDEAWAVCPFIDAFEIVQQELAFVVNSRREGGFRVEIDAAVIVPSQYIRILSGGFPDDGVATVDARETAAEEHMVFIDFAQFVMDGSEIEFRDEAEEIRLDGFLLIRHVGERGQLEDVVETVDGGLPGLVEGGDIVVCFFRKEIAEGEFCGVVGGFFHDGVEQSAVVGAVAPPAEFVVDEIAEQPWIVSL